MSLLPANTDPTLDAVDQSIIQTEISRPPRGYLSMALIGKPCSRACWYEFRWASQRNLKIEHFKNSLDTFSGKALQAKRLNQVKGVQVSHTDYDSGCFFQFSDLGGHFTGFMDGMITGLLQAPITPHAWSHKQMLEKDQRKLEKLKSEKGEKKALEAWNPTTYAQAILQMYYGEFKRHYLTCSTPGGRHTISVRTNENKTKAKGLIDKARQIIQSDAPLNKLSEDPSWFECKCCAHYDICQQNKIPEVNCRTCTHVSPKIDSDNKSWACEKYNIELTEYQQRCSCPDHIFNHHLIPMKVLDANEQENWVEYEFNGKTIKNGGRPYYSSRELNAATDLNALNIPDIIEMRDFFDAKVTG